MAKTANMSERSLMFATFALPQALSFSEYSEMLAVPLPRFLTPSPTGVVFGVPARKATPRVCRIQSNLLGRKTSRKRSLFTRKMPKSRTCGTALTVWPFSPRAHVRLTTSPDDLGTAGETTPNRGSSTAAPSVSSRSACLQQLPSRRPAMPTPRNPAHRQAKPATP